MTTSPTTPKVNESAAPNRTFKDLIAERRNLLSLWDLVKLMNDSFDIKRISRLLYLASGNDAFEIFKSDEDESISDIRDDLVSFCRGLKLEVTADAIVAMAEFYQNHGNSQDHWPNDDIFERRGLQKIFSFALQSEIAKHKLISVTRHSALWDDPVFRWDDVINQWPDAQYDIEHASRCLALSEWTACVFHLSRIAELGLRAAAQKHIPAFIRTANQPMGNYLRDIDTALGKTSPHTPGLIGLRAAAAHFARIKNVWRDEVSHTGVKFDEHEADRIYHAVRDMLTECAKIV